MLNVLNPEKHTALRAFFLHLLALEKTFDRTIYLASIIVGDNNFDSACKFDEIISMLALHENIMQ